MYETRWATYNELNIVAECWYKMACEMGEIDRIPKPSSTAGRSEKSISERI